MPFNRKEKQIKQSEMTYLSLQITEIKMQENVQKEEEEEKSPWDLTINEKEGVIRILYVLLKLGTFMFNLPQFAFFHCISCIFFLLLPLRFTFERRKKSIQWDSLSINYRREKNSQLFEKWSSPKNLPSH